eukprot:1396440-Amphidinium_carterae.3
MVVMVSGVVAAVASVSGGVVSDTVTAGWILGSERWGGTVGCETVGCVRGACGAVLASMKRRGDFQLLYADSGVLELWTVCEVDVLYGGGVGEGRLGGMPPRP